MKTKIIYAHGIRFSRNDEFADKMIGEFGPKFNHFKFNWGKIVGIHFDKYFNENYEKPSLMRRKKLLTYRARKIFWEFVGDVLIYFTKKDLLIDELYENIRDEENVVIIAHSMGCIIIDEMLQKYRPSNIDRIITMGNPLAIFRIGKKEDPKHRWYDWNNYYEPNDIVATKLKRVLGYSHVKDIKFNSNHIIKSWNFLAHTVYWKSNELIKIIKNDIE